MFAYPFNQIKNSVRSSFASLSLRSSEPIGISIITDPYTGKIAVLNGSHVLRTLAHSKTPTITVNHLPPKESDSPSFSFLDRSEQTSPLLEASSSSDSDYNTPLFPNSRLFRGSQDEFGFDVYITVHYGHYCEPAHLFECPVVLPWDQLVAALAVESGCEAKNVVLSSKFYPGVLDDNVSYQRWLAWSRKNDGPCSTDLWLSS